MDTLKFNNNGVKLIAHRGLSGIEAENTVSAFVAAANRSYWGIETDIHLTADGIYAVIHDDSTKRTCEKSMKVEKSTYADLSKLHVYDRFGVTRIDLRIPRLEEYFYICRIYGKHPVLELKNPFPKKNVKEIYGIAKDFDLLSDIIFISFSIDNLLCLREIDEDIKIQYLVKKFKPEYIPILKKHNFGIDISAKALTAEIAVELKQNGIEINCWTCDLPEDAEKLADFGADYITTNILE